MRRSLIITGRDADAGERAAAAIRRDSGRQSVSFLQADHATVADDPGRAVGLAAAASAAVEPLTGEGW